MNTDDGRLAATRFVDRPTPVHVFGDSHCLIFADLLFYESRFFHRHFITQAHYLPGFCASAFSAGNEQLHAGLIQAMVAAGLLNGALQPVHVADGELARAEIRAGGRGRPAPILLFCLGDIDVRSIFLKQLGPRVDFRLPFLPPESPFAVDHSAFPGIQPIPYKLVLQMIEKLVQPLFYGFYLLRSIGFRKLFLHSLPPQTLSDADFVRINGFAAPLSLRYKATLAFNQVLRTRCAEQRVGFVDIWPSVTEHDQLRPEYGLDQVHLNRRAAELSVATLLARLPDSGNSALAAQYQRLYEQTQGRSAPKREAAIAEAFARERIYRRPAALSSADLERLTAVLHFDTDVGNRHFRLDWVGNTLTPFSARMRSATLGAAELAPIQALLYRPDLRRLIESCTGYAYTVICCRAFLSLPHADEGRGPQAFHRDHSPPGLLRALIYLTDVDEQSGPFEYIDPANGESRRVTAPAGSLIVFDANAFEHRGRPPLGRERKVLDLVLCPAIPGLGASVVWPGMNHWPVDPFHFSLTGFGCWPPPLSAEISFADEAGGA